MILLPNEYTLRGRKQWRYRIVKREGDIVFAEMHRMDRIEGDKEDDNKEEAFNLNEKSLQGYEVFIVQKYQERMRPDKKGMIPAKESPPPDYYWGRYGHSFAGSGMSDGSCLRKAEEQYQIELISQEERIKNREKKAQK